MNSSEPKRQLVIGILLILLAAGFLALAGFLSWNVTAALVAPTPEDAVQQVLQATHEGKYAEAAAYLEGGPDSPDLAELYLDRITDRGHAVTFKVLNRGQKGDEHLLQIATYGERAEPLSVATWYFIRKGRHWVIRKVG